MKISDHSFRDFYYRFCAIHVNDVLYRSISEIGNRYKIELDNVDAVLAFGYIDVHAGLTFEILACRDHEAKTFNHDLPQEYRLMMRYGSVQECEIEMLEDNQICNERYEEKINSIKTHYSPSKQVEIIRGIRELDSCRSPEFPDDILVFLFKKDTNPEGCWARPIEIAEGHLRCELLNDTDVDMGVHRGSVIDVNITSQDGRISYPTFLSKECLL